MAFCFFHLACGSRTIGEVSIEQLVTCCMMMKGEAKALTAQALHYNVTNLSEATAETQKAIGLLMDAVEGIQQRQEALSGSLEGIRLLKERELRLLRAHPAGRGLSP